MKAAGRLAVAFTTRTSTPNKEWPQGRWTELVARTSTFCTWIHAGGDILKPRIPNVIYRDLTVRETIALTAVVDAVVTLDTFLLHAAACRRRSGVIVLLGSTRPECVSYPAFTNLYVEALPCQPCGRPFHRFDVSYGPDGEVRRYSSGRVRKWECPHVECMAHIEVSAVEQALRHALDLV